MSNRQKSGAAAKSSRAIAYQCLLRWAKGGVFAETLITRHAADLSASDRAMVQAIVMGTLRNKLLLEHWCGKLRDGYLDDAVRWLVMLGLCQLFVINLAEHAAVSETVSIAPAKLRGLVNAMLRSALRRKAEFEAELPQLPLSVRYSTPSWLVDRWLQEFGEADTQQMLAWNILPPPVYVRMNPLHPMDVPEAWQPLPHAQGWYKLPYGIPHAALREGRVYVADPSTRYCIELLNPQKGERILDACAAPGGKSAAIIAATAGEVDLLATDSAPHRMDQLKENMLRAGGKKIQVRCHDWTSPCPDALKACFDAVLLDVPCSNSGVLQRRVDARWRMQESEFERLSVLQSAILEQASAAVRPGGRLVYSTCSIDAQEDRSVVDAFLARHPEFSLARDYLALPHKEQADGAYAALLLRTPSTHS